MSSRLNPQATVIPVRIFQRDPETYNRRRFGDQVRRILMPADFTSDPGLFENVHGLPQQRCLVADGTERLCKHSLAAKIGERRHLVMHCMANLVDGRVPGVKQYSLLIQRIFFQKAVHGPGGLHEIAVTAVILVFGGKYGAVPADIEIVNNLLSRGAN